MRTGWPSAAKTSARECESEAGSLPRGQQERHRLASSKTQPASSMPVTSSSSPVMPQVRYAAASSKTRPVSADAQAIPSIKSGFSCAPRTRNLTLRQQERLRAAFTANEAHISVEVAYHCAQHVRDVFHQATPAQGQHLATHLTQRLPARLIPEIARLGPDPTQTEGRTRRLLRHSRSQQRTPPKPSTDIIERGRRTARGYPNPTNHQLRMLLITGALDAYPATTRPTPPTTPTPSNAKSPQPTYPTRPAL